MGASSSGPPLPRATHLMQPLPSLLQLCQAGAWGHKLERGTAAGSGRCCKTLLLPGSPIAPRWHPPCTSLGNPRRSPRPPATR